MRCISLDDGLPGSYVDDIMQDSRGFAWLALSGGGLCRWDGHEFLGFTTATQSALKSNFIKNICEDRYGRLWISSDKGIDLLDLATLQMLPLPQCLGSDIAQNYVSSVCLDAKGCVWINTPGTLARVEFSPDGGISDVLRYSDAGLQRRAMVIKDVDSDGSVWACLSGKLCRIAQGADGQLVCSPLFDTFCLEEETYVSQYVRKGDDLWVSTEAGLWRYSYSNRRWRRYLHESGNPRSLSQNFLTDICLGTDGTMYVSSLKGLNEYDPTQDNFKRNSELPSDFINCMRNFAGQLWLGTESAGLILLRPCDPSVSNIGSSPVNTIYQDESGQVWVGCVEGGLYCCSDFPGGEHRHFDISNSALGHNSVSALAQDGNGTLWVGTWGGGISLCNPLQPSVSFRQFATGTRHNLDYIGALQYDGESDRMWIGTNKGLYCYDMASDNLPQAVSTMGVLGSCIDGAGRLWVGGSDSLYVVDTKNNTYISYPEKFSSIVRVSDGSIWLGSIGRGLYHTCGAGKDPFDFSVFSLSSSPSGNTVKGILEDGDSCLWLSTDAGIVRFNPADSSRTTYTTEDGLASNQFYWNAYCRMRDGLLCFGTGKGMTTVDPSAGHNDCPPCSISFTSLEIGVQHRDISASDCLPLHERDKSIVIGFALLDYGTMPGAVCEYYAEGLDNQWIPLKQSMNYIGYGSLPHGQYVLHVRARNKEGVTVASTRIGLDVTPYFYRTWWFKALALFLLAVVVALFLYARTHKLQEEVAHLQSIVREKTADEALRQRIDEVMMRRFSDPAFGVEEFSREVGVSRTQLNKKLQELTGNSPGHYLSEFRLARSYDMMVHNSPDSGLNVSEVAYRCGFNDPKYFSRCFSKKFGMSPSAVMKGK